MRSPPASLLLGAAVALAGSALYWSVVALLPISGVAADVALSIFGVSALPVALGGAWSARRIHRAGGAAPSRAALWGAAGTVAAYLLTMVGLAGAAAVRGQPLPDALLSVVGLSILGLFFLLGALPFGAAAGVVLGRLLRAGERSP